MAGLADLVVKIGADLRDFNKGMDSVGQKLSGAGKSLQKTGAVLTASVTAPIVAFGASAVRSAADFETGMNRVQALTGASTSQFNALEKEAKRLGATTAFSASEAADAMGFLAMAGFDSDQILGSMNDTLNLAAAAQMDLGSAADTVSNIMTGYGLSTEETAHATDVLVKTMSSANTDLSQLGEAMKYAGPVASGVGVAFEEAAAAIGLMGNAGIQGSMAGTSLRGAISRLASPTANAVGLLETLAARAGITGVNMEDMAKKVGSGVGPFGDMASTIDFLTESGATAGEMMELFGQRAGPAMQALVSQGSGALRDLTHELENSGGTAAEIAAVQMSGFNGAMAGLRSAFEAVQIAIAESGLLDFVTSIVTSISDFLRGVADLNPTLLKWGTIIAGVVAAIGPLVLVLGTVLVALPQLIAGIGIVSTALAGLSISGGPIFLTVAAIAALVAGIVALYTHWDEVTAFMQGAWLSMKLRIMGGITELLKGMSSLFDWIPGADSLFSSAIKSMEEKTGKAAIALADFNLERARAAVVAKDHEEAIEGVADALVNVTEEQERVTTTTRGGTTEAQEAADAMARYAELVNEVKQELEKANPKLKEATYNYGELKKATEKSKDESISWLHVIQREGGLTDALGALSQKIGGKAGLVEMFGRGGLQGVLGGVLDKVTGGKGLTSAFIGLATKAIPGIGPAIGVASGILKTFGVDTEQIFNGIANTIGKAFEGIGKKIAGLFAGFRKESQKQGAMDRFLAAVSASGIDVTDMSAADKSKLKQLMVAPMTQGVSQADLLAALGLQESDIARTVDEALVQLVSQTGDAATSALDKFAVILMNMAKNPDFVKHLGLAAGTDIIPALEQILGVSLADAKQRMEELIARRDARGEDPDGETGLGGLDQSKLGAEITDAVINGIIGTTTDINSPLGGMGSGVNTNVFMPPDSNTTQQRIVVNLDGRLIAETTAENMPEVLEVITR